MARPFGAGRLWRRKPRALPWAGLGLPLWGATMARAARWFEGDASYEAPEDPEIVTQTASATLEESVTTILEVLLPRVKGEEWVMPSI